MILAYAVFAVLLAFGAAALRIGARVASGGRPWRRRFALGGDFGDAMTHVLLAEFIRRNDHRLPKRTPKFLLSGPQDYPAIFHWLVALVPKATVERFEWLFSPAIEAMHAVLVFGAFLIGLEFLGMQPAPALAALMTVAWILSPGFALDARRGAFLNERVFGFLFANLYFLALVAWLFTGQPAVAGVAILSGVVVAVSSKFSMQALVLLTPLSSLALMDLRPLLLLAVVVLTAMLLSWGHAGFVWRGSLRHTQFYARYLVHVGDYVSSFSMSQFLEAARHLSRGSVRTAARLVLAHPIAKLFINSPAVWLALALTWVSGDHTQLQAILTAIVVAAVVVAFVTSIDTFKYLGEGERYLEIAIAPSLLLIASVAPDTGVHLIVGLIAYSAVRLVLAWRKLASRDRGGVVLATADTRALLDWLIHKEPCTIYAVPGRLAYPIAYATPQHSYVWWFINTPERSRQAEFERLFEGGSRYPYPAPHGVYALWNGKRPDIAVLHRPTIAACKSAWGIDYSAIVGETIFANDTYLVVAPNLPSPAHRDASALDERPS